MFKNWNKIQSKYKIRRILLLILVVAAVGGFVWLSVRGMKQVQTLPETDEESTPVEQEQEKEPKKLESEPEAAPEADKEELSDPEPEEETEDKSSEEEKPEKAAPMTTKNLESTVDEKSWNLILVNYANKISADHVVNLEQIANGKQVDARIADQLKKMVAKAKEDGINLDVISAYRSYDYQVGLFDDGVAKRIDRGMTEAEAKKETAKWIAVPGTSEHQTGLAVDILSPGYDLNNTDFENSAAFAWLAENAADYGFVLRYPKDKVDVTKITYEPWHYRYVGVENAKIMNSKGYCLEEYIYSAKKTNGKNETSTNHDDKNSEETEEKQED